MFPEGRAGVGLLLLRISVAVALIIELSIAHQFLFPGWLVATLLALAGLLLLGLLTRATALLHAALHASLLLATDNSLFAASILQIAVGLALYLIGPGAYSIDVSIGGRRVVILRSRSGWAEKDKPGH
jgi:hypothetical protein